MKLNDVRDRAFSNSHRKGFWSDAYDGQGNKHQHAIPVRLALIHSEVGEATEADRKGDWENFKEELADTVIRIADLCGGYSIDLEAEVAKKMAINEGRPYKHGKRY